MEICANQPVNRIGRESILCTNRAELRSSSVRICPKRLRARTPTAAEAPGHDAQWGHRRQHGAREPLPERRPPEPHQIRESGTRIAHRPLKEIMVYPLAGAAGGNKPKLLDEKSQPTDR
jgi:hypothetical protein